MPYHDGFFEIVFAYSVFTHLPEDLCLIWMSEIARVLKPNGVFCLTLEPEVLVKRIINHSKEPDNQWLQGLAKHMSSTEEITKRLNNGEFIFLPTGGGDNLTSDIYGDAIVPEKYVRKNLSRFFYVKDYQHNPLEYWLQARCCLQSKSN